MRKFAVLIAAALAAAAACRPEMTATRADTPDTVGVANRSTTASCSKGPPPNNEEEGEVFGDVYLDFGYSCSNYDVYLVPYADAAERLHMASYDSHLTASHAWRHFFEWWDPLGGSPCRAASTQTLAEWIQHGSPFAEVEHDDPAPREGHCVRPGRYHFQGVDRQMDVDYLQTSKVSIVDAQGRPMQVETNPYVDAPDYVDYADLIIHTDLTGGWTDTPVLEIQKAGTDPYVGTFVDEAAPSGRADELFRFSAARSTTTWRGGSVSGLLARLWLDGTNLEHVTGFYSESPGSQPIVRLLRLPNPREAVKDYEVGLELMRPDESPAAAPTITRTVTITRVNPDLAPGSISTPSQAFLGSPVTVTVAEQNFVRIFAAVEPNWTGKIYLSSDAVLSPATDRLVDTYVEAAPIPPGKSIQMQRQPVVPSDLASGIYYVLVSLDANAEVLEENESNNIGASGPISIGRPVIACAVFEGTRMWRMTDQVFTTLVKPTCTSGANIRYRWQTQAGGAWTPYSTNARYEFPGHPAAGSYQVTLEAKDISSGISGTDTRTFTVESGILTVSGQAEISVKKPYYTYTANTASYWWERFLPDTGWQGGTGPQTVWTRTWYGGCYEVDVRPDASGGGVLRRGRLHVTVTIGPGCQAP